MKSTRNLVGILVASTGISGSLIFQRKSGESSRAFLSRVSARVSTFPYRTITNASITRAYIASAGVTLREQRVLDRASEICRDIVNRFLSLPRQRRYDRIRAAYRCMCTCRSYRGRLRRESGSYARFTAYTRIIRLILNPFALPPAAPAQRAAAAANGGARNQDGITSRLRLRVCARTRFGYTVCPAARRSVPATPTSASRLRR